MAALEGGTEGETALAETEPAANSLKPTWIRPLPNSSLANALDKIRVESEKYTQIAIADVPAEKRFPIAVGKFMDKMINNGLVAPMMGNMLAVVLQNPKELALLSPDPKDVDVFHDMFLGVYSNAVEDFLKTVTPLFETIMGVYLLFNEFPADIKLPEALRPELVITNSDLPDLFLTREAELEQYFNWACAQANHQFNDAVSFVIVPNAAPFKKPRPPKKSKKPSIMLDDPLLAAIQAAQENAANADGGGYGAVTYVGEMLGMMEWGEKYGLSGAVLPGRSRQSQRRKRRLLLRPC